MKALGGVGVIITSLDDGILKYGIQLQFLATNNEAINHKYEAKEPWMQKYMKFTNQMTSDFEEVKFTLVPRNQNAKTYEVTKCASS